MTNRPYPPCPNATMAVKCPECQALKISNAGSSTLEAAGYVNASLDDLQEYCEEHHEIGRAEELALKAIRHCVWRKDDDD